MAWLATLPRGLRGYAIREKRHPLGKSTRHMHIKRRGTILYRVEWGTDKWGRRFINVQPGYEGDEKFAREIARWVDEVFEELTVVHDRAIRELPFKKVKWVR